MKIAFTADLHLTNLEDHPERYHAFENILLQMIDSEVVELIIAGDLFDQTLMNYSDFESLLNKEIYKDLKIHIIPGNHDDSISNAAIVLDNVFIYSEPHILEFDGVNTSILFLPYLKGKTMGEIIENHTNKLDPNNWILVGHGDWMEGIKEPNPYEPRVYMPLTSQDIRRYQPKRVFLGHIHQSSDQEKIHYIGSPCGLDITETGKRSCIVYDLFTDKYVRFHVSTDYIYFDETFLLLPMENEEEYILKEVNERILRWGISKGEQAKIKVRVKLTGYSLDRNKALDSIKKAFKNYKFYLGDDPDTSELKLSTDHDLQYIANCIKERIDALNWRDATEEPNRKDILEKALAMIYGE